MKHMDNFCNGRKPSLAPVNSTLFAVSKHEWDTKEDTGDSMIMHCMYCEIPKDTS